jgi:hypothetical protein
MIEVDRLPSALLAGTAMRRTSDERRTCAEGKVVEIREVVGLQHHYERRAA